MPVLELGDLQEPFGHYRTQVAVHSVIAWPNDVAARKQYLATVMAHNMGRLQIMEEDLPDPAKAGSWFYTVNALELAEDWRHTQSMMRQWFEEAGGFIQVANAWPLRDYEDRIAGQTRAWFAAGLILALIRRMATHHPDLPGGASVNKAVFILERNPQPWIPRNGHDLRRAWSAYKPVAHFCAALFDVFIRAALESRNAGEVGAELVRKLREGFGSFLAEADAYQQFGMAYAPPRAKGRAILDPDEAWLLPEEKQWAPTLLSPAPLSDTLLEAARAYRAPIPGA